MDNLAFSGSVLPFFLIHMGFSMIKCESPQCFFSVPQIHATFVGRLYETHKYCMKTILQCINYKCRDYQLNFQECSASSRTEKKQKGSLCSLPPVLSPVTRSSWFLLLSCCVLPREPLFLVVLSMEVFVPIFIGSPSYYKADQFKGSFLNFICPSKPPAAA